MQFNVSTGAYSIPVTMPQVPYMHHWAYFRVPQVHFMIPVEGFLHLLRCMRGTTPTLPPTTSKNSILESPVLMDLQRAGQNSSISSGNFSNEVFRPWHR